MGDLGGTVLLPALRNSASRYHYSHLEDGDTDPRRDLVMCPRTRECSRPEPECPESEQIPHKEPWARAHSHLVHTSFSARVVETCSSVVTTQCPWAAEKVECGGQRQRIISHEPFCDFLTDPNLLSSAKTHGNFHLSNR